MKLQMLPPERRPREKAVREGISSLTLEELYAILLRTGSPGENALLQAQKLIENFDCSLRRISESTIHELTTINGIGLCKAIVIQAVGEIARRFSTTTVPTRVPLQSSFEVFAHFHGRFAGKNLEEVWVVLLDIKKRIQGEGLIARGSLYSAAIEPREIFSLAMRRGSAGIIIVHNHPSGDATPSGEDRKITVRIRESGTLLGIPLIDHIIIGDREYYSFCDKRIYRNCALSRENFNNVESTRAH